MLVEDILSRDPLYVEDSTYLTKARQLIRDHHVRGLPVVNDNKHVLGIVTAQDMLRVTSTKSNVTVAGFMVQAPLVTGQMDMFDAARLMLKEKSALLPVIESMDKPRLRGVVTLLDVFKHIDLEKVPKKQIQEVMSTKVITASPDDPVTKVWDKMVEEDFTGLPVVKDGKPIGMITRFDILKRGWARISKESETRPVDSTQMRIEKLMSSPIYSIKPDDSLASAIELMRKYEIGRISIVDEGKLVGIVDRNDLIKGYLG
ncbi:MAG: Inosine-5'-monophosphate dehydrogenase [Methanosaeta sp. PtaB.Bin018]|jgi:CBS domain-containing protein|nr:CBS domain-containing protein [Methanothrix sp.]OPX76839.1 MAG: Inosine-5'-monophosphate dehydrogenase [Methanosaeta sp. PtaB.Bin018]